MPTRAIAAISLHSLPTSIQDPRLLVGALGALILLFGARFYRLVLVVPGVALGVLAGVALTPDATPNQTALASLCLGIIGAVALFFLERLAVSLVGAVLTAGLVRAALPAMMGANLPWYVPVAAGLVGMFLFPRLLRGLIKLISPLLGALLIAWSIGRPEDLRAILGLAAVGALFQLALGRRSGGGGQG